MMNSLKDIIKRCHKRHEKPLQQRKTVVTPAIYKGLIYHFTAYCAHRYPVKLYDLEQAEISFMPIGGAPTHERMPQSFGGNRFLTRQGIESWDVRQWQTSWGIQMYTGIPSERERARWHDLEFTYHALCAAPEAILACIETLVSVVSNPLLTITKSGGLRFSCRVPHYLHPNTEAERFYIYKDILTTENQYQRNVYLEILGNEGHSPWDARYEILFGSLLDPPIIAKEVLFAAIDMLRSELHDPTPNRRDLQIVAGRNSEFSPTNTTLPPPSLGSYKLNLAKEAFLRHGLAYLRQENDLHYWTQHTSENNTDVLLWEKDGTIWIRATTPDVDLPTEDTPIIAIWDNTGILPQIPETGLPVSNQILAIREGELSPLAIKRPDPVLEKPEKIAKDYETPADNIKLIQHVFDNETRITALIGADIGVRNNYAIETHLLKNREVSLSAHIPIIKEISKHFEKQNLPSIAQWRRHNYLWDKVKEIPVDVRMATPFQNGNMCEDADRCTSLVSKGVDPGETICPQCPVYKECQQRGYLSQSVSLQRENTQLIPHSKMFLNPSLSTFVEDILKPITDKERLCLIDEVRTDELFLDCYIDKNTLEIWDKEWEGYALGNFAQALLNAIETKSEPDNLLVQRIRTVMQAFQQNEEHIVKQMRQVNVRGRIMEEETIDEETGAILARSTIMFENGVSMYIPTDDTAADRLTTKGLPVLQPEAVLNNKETEISVPIEQAIRFKLLDTSTTEKIEGLPKTYQNPSWTLWHQLKRFFAHYTRDSDAPMIWHDNKYLIFWVPPVLHPNIKILLLMSPTIFEQGLRRTFTDEKVEVTQLKPNAWIKGNQVFQIRTGIHSLKTMLDYDTWDVSGLSKTTNRIVQGICAEIQRDPNIKHAIITYTPIIMQLKDIAEKENVCFITDFKDLLNLETAFEAAQVVWIIGTPFWQPGVMWRRAQILYGNDEEPLCYETDTEFQHYKDKRIQRVYIQAVTGFISEIIGRAGLNRLPDKKVVLISSLQLPNITDRPETLLFDWEDFEIAGSLEKLAETITKRQQFETERDNLTAETSREKVSQVLGCSSRHANRILQQLRGGNIPRVTYREQILSLLTDGEKKASEITESIIGNSMAINNEIARLLKIGEIVKVRWGVYALPDTKNSYPSENRDNS